ncbi:hypothetical protein [Ekhidna sp.]|uniref:hypothetical protein n=1 Tax=Ekhidna sp. TaxID=2608089 RepID=UPI003B50570F
MKNLIFLSLLIVSASTLAQNVNPITNPYNDILNPDLFNRKEYAAFKGTPFLLEEPAKGKVIFKNGEERSFEKINLDFYKNQSIVEVDGKESTLLNKYLKEIQLSSDEVGYKTFRILVENGDYVFYEVLGRDNVKLLKKRDLQLKVEDRSNATSYSGNTDTNQQKFVTEVSYFWTSDYQSLMTVSSKKKDFISDFDSVDGLGDFLKSEKLNPKNENDLIKIFDYINFKGI